MYFLILGGVFLGWSLGANDAANVFGTAVASRMVRYRTAVVLIGIFVILGALCQGGPGIRQVGVLTGAQGARSVGSACIACVVAALTVTVMGMLFPAPKDVQDGVTELVLGITVLEMPLATAGSSRPNRPLSSSVYQTLP